MSMTPNQHIAEAEKLLNRANSDDYNADLLRAASLHLRFAELKLSRNVYSDSGMANYWKTNAAE
jgi:hypothetical protein